MLDLIRSGFSRMDSEPMGHCIRSFFQFLDGVSRCIDFFPIFVYECGTRLSYQVGILGVVPMKKKCNFSHREQQCAQSNSAQSRLGTENGDDRPTRSAYSRTARGHQPPRPRRTSGCSGSDAYLRSIGSVQRPL